MLLLTFSNDKVLKGQAFGFLSAILHLAPSWLSGFNVCPMASKGCIAGCLNRAGRGVYSNTQNARIRKTRQFFTDRAGFMAQLVWDVQAVLRKAERENLSPVIRLNGTSDIRWEYIPVTLDGVEYPNIMIAFPHVQFMDYTKIPNRRDIPENYHLTFSRAESNDVHVQTAMDNGMNVAVVFLRTLPETYLGRKVIDGTKHDARFIDPRNVVVGLLAKGPAKRDTSGFVIAA